MGVSNLCHTGFAPSSLSDSASTLPIKVCPDLRVHPQPVLSLCPPPTLTFSGTPGHFSTPNPRLDVSLSCSLLGSSQWSPTFQHRASPIHGPRSCDRRVGTKIQTCGPPYSPWLPQPHLSVLPQDTSGSCWWGCSAWNTSASALLMPQPKTHAHPSRFSSGRIPPITSPPAHRSPHPHHSLPGHRTLTFPVCSASCVIYLVTRLPRAKPLVS